MNWRFSFTALALAAAISCSPAQAVSSGSGQASSGNAQSSTQASQSSQTASQKGSNQNTPASKVPGGATDASGGGVAGAAGSAAGQTQVPESPQTPAAAAAPSDSDLQTQIQNALSKEPTLSGDTVNVSVSADSIAVNGSVATSREKQTATRIVQSYAGNKKVVSRLTVSGRNRNAAPAAASPKQSGEGSGPANGDLSSHPEPNKSAPPAASGRPPL
jgi:osmotically-inducible protein OsmY